VRRQSAGNKIHSLNRWHQQLMAVSLMADHEVGEGDSMLIDITMPSMSEVKFSYAGDFKAVGVNTSAYFADGRGMRGYGFGPHGYMDVACRTIVPSTVRSRRSFGDYEIVTALGIDGLVTTAAIRGPHNEIVTIFGGPPIEDVQVEAAFSGFDYLDTETGFTMVPSKGSNAVLQTQDATVVVEGGGVVQVLIGRDALSITPSWSGTQLQDGEVWRSVESDGTSYVVGFDSAAVQIDPGSFADTADPSWMEWLTSLNVEDLGKAG
jgi:hypothetical protein